MKRSKTVAEVVIETLCNKSGEAEESTIVQAVYEAVTRGEVSAPHVRFFRRVDTTMWSPEIHEVLVTLEAAGLVKRKGTSTWRCTNYYH